MVNLVALGRLPSAGSASAREAEQEGRPPDSHAQILTDVQRQRKGLSLTKKAATRKKRVAAPMSYYPAPIVAQS
jgi:hypothetical protein